MASIRDEQVVWGGMGWVVGRVGSQKGVYLILGHRQQCCIFNKQQKQNTTHSIGKDSCWQQFGTTDILIDVVYWHHRPCNVPSCFGRVSNKLYVKADLAIYSHMLGMSG